MINKKRQRAIASIDRKLVHRHFPGDVFQREMQFIQDARKKLLDEKRLPSHYDDRLKDCMEGMHDVVFKSLAADKMSMVTTKFTAIRVTERYIVAITLMKEMLTPVKSGGRGMTFLQTRDILGAAVRSRIDGHTFDVAKHMATAEERCYDVDVVRAAAWKV